MPTPWWPTTSWRPSRATPRRSVPSATGSRPWNPLTLDAVPPAAEFLVLDADASQQAVIETVVRGSDSVVQGPPGTGKSQTIANLIASATAQGLRVLFVAEKRAAIDAVVGRLDRTGLGGPRPGPARRGQLAPPAGREPRRRPGRGPRDGRAGVGDGRGRSSRRGARSWPRMRGASTSGANPGASACMRPRRARWRRGGWAWTCGSRPGPWTGSPRTGWTRSRRRCGHTWRSAAADLADGTHAWSAARTVDAGAVEALSDAATDLARDELPRLRGLAGGVAAEAGLPAPATAAAGFEQALVLDERARLAASVRDEAFDHAPRLSPLLEPARRGWVARVVAQVTSGPYRAALAEARTLLASTSRDHRRRRPRAHPRAPPRRTARPPGRRRPHGRRRRSRSPLVRRGRGRRARPSSPARRSCGPRGSG